MRYHYKKPVICLTMYGKVYICNHPVYNRCTLFQIGDKGLAVIQQRFSHDTKSTYWSEIDPWLGNDLYLHPKFKKEHGRNENCLWIHNYTGVKKIGRASCRERVSKSV